MISKITKLTLVFLFFALGTSYAQISTPRPSPEGSVYSKVGLTDVTIDYFRPKMKGRTIFGNGEDVLIPNGEIWRTGANSGTKITFSTDVQVAGEAVSAGEYLIFTVPGEGEWKFMLYTDLSLGGNVGGYDSENEVLNVAISPKILSEPVETLSFQIADISEDNTSASIQMQWSNMSLEVPFTVDFDQIVMEDIAAKTAVDPAIYAQAAGYYYETDKDLEQALEWINLYLAEEGNDAQFWNVHLKAQILAKLGRNEEAISTAKKSMETAKANDGGDFGYIKRNEMLIEELSK